MSNTTFKLAVFFFLILMAVAALGQIETPSGAPPDYNSPATVPPIWDPDIYDSNPRTSAPIPPAPTYRSTIDDSGTAATAPTSARPSEALLAVSADQQPGTHVAIALMPESNDRQADLAMIAAELWNAGQNVAAVACVQQLESQNAPFVLLIDWIDPMEPGMRIGGPDRQVMSIDTVDHVVLDFHRASGNTFCGLKTSTNSVILRKSIDGGSTWTAASSLSSTSAIRDFDMAVVGDFVYIGILWESNPHYVWIHRFSSDTGFHDSGYSATIATTSEEIADIAVATNEDSFRNRVYFSTIQSGGALRHFWDVSTDGTTFTEIATGVADAAGMLDMHWNQNYDTRYLFISYVTDANSVSVLGRAEGEWALRVVDADYTGTVNRTAVSAHADAVFLAYSEELENGYGIRYRVSYDAGETWNYGDVFVPAAGEGSYRMFDFTVRGGAGSAAIAQQEVGEPDPVWFRSRAGYAAGLWNDAAQFNDYDVTTGSWVCMNWLPPFTTTPGSYSYGAVYLSGGTPYFDRIDLCGGDLNNDGVISLSDLAILLSHFGQAATYAQGDLDQDGIVGLSDLAQILSVFGLECSN